MKMKRLFSMLLVTLLTVSTFVGCTGKELSFYKLSKEMTTLAQSKPVHSEGKVSISLDTLPEELTGDDLDESEKEVVDKVVALFNDNSFVYTMDSDVQSKKLSMEFEIQSKDGEMTPLLKVVRDVDTTYVKLDDYFDYIKGLVATFASEEDVIAFEDELNNLLGDMEYISISDDELIDFYAELITSSMGQDQADMIKKEFESALDPEAQNNLVDAQYKFFDDILAKGYRNYSFDIVNKEGINAYSMTLDADNLGDTAIGFLQYSLDNSQTLIDVVKDYITNLSDEEYSLLVGIYAMDTLNKDVMMDAMDQIADDLETNKADYKEQLQQAVVLYNGMYKAYIEGSKLQITLGKTKDTYTRDIELKVQVNDPDTEEVQFDATMLMNESTEEIDTPNIERPTKHVLTFMELLESIPKTMTLYPDYDMYMMTNMSQPPFSSSGTMHTIISDDHSYVPLRMIGEAFGETVGWDETENKPYIENDGTKVYFDDVILEDGVSYVKTRAFEQLGYTISWDEYSAAITLEK